MSRFNPTALRSLAFVIATTAAAHADITVTQSGGTLKVKFDAAGGTTRLLGTSASGDINAFVNNMPAGEFAGIHDIQVKGGAGEDTLHVHGIQIGGSLKAAMSGGIDSVRIESDFDADRELLIAGDVNLSLGGQAGDQVFIATDNEFGLTFARNLSVRGANFVLIHGSGQSLTSEASDVRVGGNVLVDSNGAGATSMDFANVNVHGTTIVKTRGEDDALVFNRCHVVRKLEIRMGGGDDHLTFGANNDENRFGAAVVLDGGPGIDSTNVLSTGIFAEAPKLKQFESIQ